MKSLSQIFGKPNIVQATEDTLGSARSKLRFWYERLRLSAGRPVPLVLISMAHTDAELQLKQMHYHEGVLVDADAQLDLNVPTFYGGKDRSLVVLVAVHGEQVCPLLVTDTAGNWVYPTWADVLWDLTANNWDVSPHISLPPRGGLHYIEDSCLLTPGEHWVFPAEESVFHAAVDEDVAVARVLVAEAPDTPQPVTESLTAATVTTPAPKKKARRKKGAPGLTTPDAPLDSDNTVKVEEPTTQSTDE